MPELSIGRKMSFHVVTVVGVLVATTIYQGEDDVLTDASGIFAVLLLLVPPQRPKQPRAILFFTYLFLGETGLMMTE